MRILFAVSDHGFGHATRTVALLREALGQRPDLTAIALSGPIAASLLSRSFRREPRVTVLVRRSDPGLLLVPGSLRVDRFATEAAWQDWTASWPAWVEELALEVGSAGGCDVVLSDATPPAFLLAEKLARPGALIGNFAWTDLLPGLLSEELLATVRAAHRPACATFAYPFRMGFDAAPPPVELPLVARRPTRSRAEIRLLLGADPDVPLIYLSSGQSASPRDLWTIARDRRARLLVPWNAPEIPTGPGEEEALRIPMDDPEGQDFLAAADLVVGKIGYGTLSEALACGVPMVMMLVAGTPETAPLQAGMTEAGAGEALPAGTSPAGAIARWLGRGGGTARPWRAERTREAARQLLGALDVLVAPACRPDVN